MTPLPAPPLSDDALDTLIDGVMRLLGMGYGVPMHKCHELVAALRALQRERTATRERVTTAITLAQAVLDDNGTYYCEDHLGRGKWRYYYKCDRCDGESEGEDAAAVIHMPDCPITLARVLLAASGTQADGTSEGDGS